MNITLIGSGRRVVAACFILVLAASIPAFTARAQVVRGIGAGGLVLDDSHGNTVSITSPVYSNPATGEYRAWKNAGFPELSWSIPIPPFTGAQSGFVYNGPLTPTTGPYPSTPFVLYWLYPNEPSISGDGNSGGPTGSWDYATPAELGVVTSTGTLGNNEAVVTNGTGSMTTITNGGTNTLLHGTTPPTWSAVSLSSDVSGMLPITSGGTGLTATPTDGQLLIGKTSTSSFVLSTLTAGAGITIGNAGGAITITNTGLSNPMTTLGDMLYENNTPAPARLVGSTTPSTKEFLTSTATAGGVAQAPAWGTISATDIPTLNQNTTGTASNVTGTVAVANGGTGDNTLTSGDLLLGNGTSAVTAGPAWNGSTLTGNISGNAGGTASNVTGTVAVANGGTGDNTLTSGDLLLGNGTSAVTAGPAWNGTTLTGNISGNAGGTAANVTGTVVVANGGTGDVTLTSGDLLLGNGTSAVTAGPAWNGTTLTGNISGTASNVTGTVAVANGGTGDVTLTNGDLLLGNGTSAVTAGPAWNGSTLTGNISGNAGGTASNVTGTVAIANGGTGQTTASGAINALLPSQGGNSGDVLSTNGTVASWEPVPSGSVSAVSVVTANGFAGTVANSSTTPAITISTGVTGILYGNGTSIAAATLGEYPTFNQNTTGTAANVTGTVAVANGGTGDVTLTSGDLLLGNGTSAVTAGPAWNGTTLTGNISGTASNVTGTVAVANGGTGDVTLTSGDLLLGNGTSAVTAGPAWNGTTLTGNISGNAGGTASNVTGTVAIANGGTGQTTASGAINALLPSEGGNSGDVLTTNGTIASWEPIPSGSVTTVSVVTANGFAGTVANSSTTPAITISTGVTGILYGNGTSIAAATLGEYPTFNQNTTGTAANVTGTVAVANGGTGDNTLTSGDLLLGNGTSAVTAGPAWNGTTLTGNITGNASGTASNVTGTVAVANGGTGDVTLTSGDLLLGNGTSAVTAGPAWNGTTLTGNISGNAGGTASNVTGTVAIANGGTGQTTAPNAINALLPSQGGNSGDVLTTNGTIASWEPIPSGSVTTVSVVTANGFAGTVANSSTTPAITISTGVTGILYGNGTSIAAATLGEYPTFNQNTTGTAANVTGTVAVANGGTGDNTLTSGDLLLGNGTSAVTAGPAWNGTTLTGNISGNAGGTASNVTGTVAIANGGTGQTTASGAINALLPAQGASAGDFLTTNGTVASWAPNPSGSVTTVSVVTANGFAGTVANSSTTPAITISTGVTGILYGNGTSIAAATLGEYPTFNQNTTGTAANVTGTVAVANGGTGDVTLTSGDLLLGNGTSAVTAGPAWNGTTLTGNISGTASNVTGTVAVANGGTGDVTLTSGDLLLGNGTSAVTAGPAWNGTTLTGNISGNAGGTASNVTGTVAIANGGTGQTTAPNAINALLPSQGGNSGDVLTTDGTIASWEPIPSGSVTTVSVVSANGFAGTVANSSTTPAITISTGVTGILYGNGTSIAAATLGEYPTFNQNTTGTAANVTGTVAVANGGTGLATIPIHSVLIGEGTSNVAVATPSSGSSGYVLTSNGNGSDPTWQAPAPSAKGVDYDINTGAAQATAESDSALFDVGYASGAAITPGAFINTVNSGSGTATGLTVSAAGGTTNNAIVTTFNPTSSSTGISINGTTTASTGGSFGLLIGTTHAPDIAAKLEGVTGDLFTAGGLTSTAATPAYSIKLAGSTTDNTDHSGAAIGITGPQYTNGIFAQGTVSGVYGVTTATTVIPVNNSDYDFNGSFTGSFGVRGEAVGTASEARVIGVWGLASGNSATNTSSIGVLAQGGNGETTAGATNVALDVENGELTMGRTTIATGDTGTYIVTSGISEGPSGEDSIPTSFASESGPYVQKESFSVGNEYCAANSIVLVTVENDPDANSAYMAQAIPQKGYFKLILTQSVVNSVSSSADPKVKIGYIIINPSR